MEINLNEQLQKLRTYKEIRWKLLLLDDFAQQDLKICKNTKESNKSPNNGSRSKEVIISKLLNECDLDFTITCVKSVLEAVNKLQEEQYDIILLDFLLGESSKKSGREYGHELLKKIDENPLLHSRKGPLDYYWIFPISIYTTSFFDKLREQRLQHHSEHWHLARGADPVNTPELFKFLIFKLMTLQIDEVEFTSEKLVDHFYYNLRSCKPSEVRDWAKSYYQIFITRFGRLNIIKQDREESLFSETMYDYMLIIVFLNLNSTKLCVISFFYSPMVHMKIAGS